MSDGNLNSYGTCDEGRAFIDSVRMDPHAVEIVARYLYNHNGPHHCDSLEAWLAITESYRAAWEIEARALLKTAALGWWAR